MVIIQKRSGERVILGTRGEEILRLALIEFHTRYGPDYSNPDMRELIEEAYRLQDHLLGAR